MANPLHTFLRKEAVTALCGRATVFLRGIAQDFWKDGTENPFKRGAPNVTPRRAAFTPVAPAPVSTAAKPGSMEWHALPGEIAEKMWGEGHIVPGGDALTEMLVKPLGLSKDMVILDLSAGLGGAMRKMTGEFGVSITGLEADSVIAARGAEMARAVGKDKAETVSPYIPSEFTAGKTVTRLYDVLLAREIFYRVQDKQAFFGALAASAKPQAQISFTDYLVNPEDRGKPAITHWMAHEKGAAPLGLVDAAEAWAKAGFKLRVHDDQTDYYRKEVLIGLKRFAVFLGTAARPDIETRKTILRELENWMYRLAAMEEGMKFYRFYGTK